MVAAHPAVQECAVIGIADELKGQVPLGLVVLKSNIDFDEGELQREIVASVREQVGAVASFKKVIVVRQLPKTRSGKILRRIMRSMVQGEEFQAPSTIEEPAVLEELAKTLRESDE